MILSHNNTIQQWHYLQCYHAMIIQSLIIATLTRPIFMNILPHSPLWHLPSDVNTDELIWGWSWHLLLTATSQLNHFDVSSKKPYCKWSSNACSWFNRLQWKIEFSNTVLLEAPFWREPSTVLDGVFWKSLLRKLSTMCYTTLKITFLISNINVPATLETSISCE